ncbi:FAD-binding oxidoreductase [Pseudonocardia ailaonensis]|uniref:FAD-binding oxidoreductase n=1 Tax=Pseudonocardia ailaonensis TaxID=367279 RepID=A0ABN2NNG1_9PSEU
MNWGERSLWLDGLDIVRRPGLQGDLSCDVVVVGGGFTGLWTAYYLRRAQPDLRVVVLEREIAGFGPSGRNGGWVSTGMAGPAKAFGVEGAARRRAERLTYRTVDEMAAVVEREGIDCAFRKEGQLSLATTEPQRRRLTAQVEAARGIGLTSDDLRLLQPDELDGLLHLPEPAVGSFTPHGARVDPGRLVRGLADACERLGVQILEGTEAREIAPGRVRCLAGTVRADHVLVATESYTVQQQGQGRRFLPLYSLMVATEPLPEEVWKEIGWRDGLLVRDTRHLFFYAQRTADGRIAMGGRGAPYRFGSPIADDSERNDDVRARLVRALHRHFPAAADAAVTHHWGGPLAVPRDWAMSVRHDPVTGLGWAGGYSGHGVVASNISGRTLADMVLGQDTELLSMPWVEHRSRSWEPEPLRFVASQAIIRVLERADAIEDSTGRTSRRAVLVSPFMPGH